MSQTLTGLPVHLGGTKDAATFPLWPAAPNDSIVYGIPRWYVRTPGGTNNKDFDYALKGLHSFCLVI